MTMKKFGFMVIATLCLFSEMHRAFSNDDSNGEFSSLLETVVGDVPISQPFRINGPNGFCAHTTNWIFLQLRDCGTTDLAERFRIYDDGTLRVNSKCLTARGSIKGSLVEPDNCNNTNKSAITWQVKQTDRQIIHPATGLVLSAISGGHRTPITLEANEYSSYQTWRLDYDLPVRTARIVGMRNLCLLSSPENDVWLGTCGSGDKWRIYPDGSIRPQHRPTHGCLSSTMVLNTKVFITTCGLAPSAERWVLNGKSAIVNEKTNLVLDVYNSDPSVKNVQIHPFHGQQNQQWTIVNDP